MSSHGVPPPGGRVPPSPLDLLVASLLRSAKKHARAAVGEFTVEGEAARSTVDAATAVEHLTKSYLASLHPTLLVEDRTDLDTLLHLSGNGRAAGRSFDQIKTIGGEIACARLARIAPQFTFGDRERRLFAARNAAMHLGVGNAGQAQVAVQTMVGIVAQLLELLEFEEVRFWETTTEAARTLRDQSLEAVGVTVHSKVHSARVRLNERIYGVPPEHRPMVLNALAGELPPGMGDLESSETCPACGQQGWVVCTVEDAGGADPEVTYVQIEEDEFTWEGYIERMAYPTDFLCQVCGLQLEGPEELEAAGIEADGFDIEPREIEPDGADRYWFRDYDDD